MAEILYSIMPQTHNFEQIIAGFLRGDREETKTMLSFIDAAFYSWRQRLGHHEDAIKSDVMYKLLIECRNDAILDKSKLRGYIGTMMKYTCLTYKRLGDRFTNEEIETLGLPDMALNPEQKLLKREMGIVFHRVLERISENCLELWKMYLEDRLKYKEIAKIKNVPVGTIKYQFSQCRDEANEIRENIIKNDQPF